MNVKEINQQILNNLSPLLPGLILGKTEVDRKISGQLFDLVIKIRGKGQQEWLLACEIKRLLQPRMAREISAQLRGKLVNLNRVYPVLVTTFLGERTREILKKDNIGYMDLAGNCYLRFNNIYIEKVMDKNPYINKRKLKTTFKPVSSRILRVLLEEPKRTWKILELSRVAKVSLGQTSNVCRWLIDEEYMERNKEGFYSLTSLGKLLDEWAQNYTYTNNKVFVYYSFEQEFEKLIKKIRKISVEEELKYALTLSSGASLVAPFVRGLSTLQMYISGSEDLPKWISFLDLRPIESGGNVSLYIPYDEGVFYKMRKVKDIKVVGNIQLYLDLYNYPARGREQAEFLRKKKIKF